MTGRLAGRVALITGAAGGIGRATARLFAREGARVIATDLDEGGARAVAAELGPGALAFALDVTREEAWARVMAEIESECGGLDVLVNNAGILISGHIESLSLADWRRLQSVNADSVFLGTQAGVRAMKVRGGAIVNIASVASWLPIDAYAGYGASKAAVAAITRAAALHCRKCRYPIRVNSVHPDGVWTPMMEGSMRELAPQLKPEHVLFDVKNHPAGRCCQPEEVAHAILFLASDEASAIRGLELRVDNGILGMGL